MPEIPTIEPFQFIRSTAFSERVQLANKLNEVIDALNQIGSIDDLQTQIDAINSEISELEESIGNTDTSLADLENQVNGLISEVNTTIKQSISALESDVDGIDTRLTTAEGTISEHGTEIDGLLKEVIDNVAMMSNPHGTIQVQINHEDGSNDISAPIDLGLVEQGGIVLQSGTTDRSFKLIVKLTDGTSWQTNDFVIPEGGGTDVSVTNISIAQGTGTNMIQVKIGLSDGSTISSNDWTVVTPAEFSALGTRVTTAEGKITKNTGDISDLETRVQAIEDSPGFTLQPATATRLGGVKIGTGITVASDGTISIPNVSASQNGLMTSAAYQKLSNVPDPSTIATDSEIADVQKQITSLKLSESGANGIMLNGDTVKAVRSVSGSVNENNLMITVNGVSGNVSIPSSNPFETTRYLAPLDNSQMFEAFDNDKIWGLTIIAQNRATSHFLTFSGYETGGQYIGNGLVLDASKKIIGCVNRIAPNSRTQDIRFIYTSEINGGTREEPVNVTRESGNQFDMTCLKLL